MADMVEKAREKYPTIEQLRKEEKDYMDKKLIKRIGLASEEVRGLYREFSEGVREIMLGSHVEVTIITINL